MTDARPSLADFQARFAASLRKPEDGSALSLFSPSERIPLARRFDVYRNNVHASLVDALADIFPAVERLVGRDFFRASARLFLADSMPSLGTLMGFGDGFPEFLDRFEPAARLPYLGDVARLELLWLAAYHAGEAPPVDPGALQAGDDPSGLCLRFHPSAALLSSSWPVFQIWRSNREDAEVMPIDLDTGPDFLMVFRSGGEVRIASLDLGMHAFCEKFAAGAALGDAAEAAAAVDTDFDLVAAFRFILSSGAFAAPLSERGDTCHVQHL
ncbi:DNA-binding domain-containing protein [Parvibaculum sp.]|uniref:HvfC/BufC N-terminal domain-containing protein n=1 Tax=Parvibaculum sp. TaxID=2024848 RepID=UPI000C8E7500|nr:DNA-binding domain-containing protein [Parvibaculum sp.]MAB12864.1 DUF2063 domain-containing protein [Parvibaculum sp.]